MTLKIIKCKTNYLSARGKNTKLQKFIKFQNILRTVSHGLTKKSAKFMENFLLKG
jgi:hypothetical protein